MCMSSFDVVAPIHWLVWVSRLAALTMNTVDNFPIISPDLPLLRTRFVLPNPGRQRQHLKVDEGCSWYRDS